MISMKRFALALGILLVFSSWPALAQSSTGQSTAPGQSTTGRNGRGNSEPCWKQVGIPQSVAQKHRQLQQSARSEVQSVCKDSSLSTQQKQEKIKQIREQTRQQMEGLLTSQQEQQLKACRQQHGSGGHGGQKRAGRGGENPCGELAGGNGKNANEPGDTEPDSDQE